MKTKAVILLASKKSHLAFACACALLAGSGWSAKLAMDEFIRIEERLDRSCDDTAFQCIWSLQHKTNALRQPTLGAPTFFFPTNPAAPVLQ
jgi:hypothetical protein